MATLGFTQVGNKYESDEMSGLEKDTVLELNFDAIPEELGVKIDIYISLSKTGWSLVFSDVLRQGLTWCRSVAGVSEKAYYKVETTVEPTSASYE